MPLPSHDSSGVPNPVKYTARFPEVEAELDRLLGKANKSAEPEADERDPSYLPVILFAVLTLASVLAVLIFIVASKPG